MSANGPPRITFESIVVHDAKRRLRLVMELLEQEWRRQQTHGASKPHANEEFQQNPQSSRQNHWPSQQIEYTTWKVIAPTEANGEDP